MSPEKDLDPEQQLAALGKAQSNMDQAMGYGARLMGWYSIFIALAVGALAFLLHRYRPDEHLAGFIVIMALYMVAIVSASFAYRRLYRSLPAGYSKRYNVGFALTMALYAASLAFLAADPGSWIIPTLTWIVVSAPLLVVGIGMVRK